MVAAASTSGTRRTCASSSLLRGICGVGIRTIDDVREPGERYAATEAGVDGNQIREAPDEQSLADHEDERQRG